MKRQSASNHKSKSRSVARSASTGLIDFIKAKYDRTIPVSFVTAAHKLYGKNKALNKEDRFITRFSDARGNIDTNKFVDYLGKAEHHEKGKPLTEESLRRVYDNGSNHDGKLTFEYIMKMGEKCGISINATMAKAMVRKYGGRKDHLSFEDCIKINKRRQEAAAATSRRRWWLLICGLNTCPYHLL